MRRHYIDKHRETDSGADNSVPLHSEVLILTRKQRNKLGQRNLTNLSIDQQNDQPLSHMLIHAVNT